MHQYKLIGVFILSLLSVASRCQSGEDRESSPVASVFHRPHISHHLPYRHDYVHSRLTGSSCETETQAELAEVKSEIHNLQQLVIGLRQKLDPDFKMPPPPESRCPPGFQYLSRARSCYKVVYEEHNWTSAGQRCHNLHPDAHLVAITKTEENNALKSYLEHDLAQHLHLNVCKFHSWGDENKMLWTSGQRVNESNCSDPFVWKISNSTQVPLSFTNWSPSEPNCAFNKESCIHMRPTSRFQWNDLTCEHKICPLCEYDPS